MLSIRHLSKSYANFNLSGISFDVPDGAVVGLIGENGAGKSTLLKCILGAVSPDGGQIALAGKPLSSLTKRERQRIAFVLDDVGLPLELGLKATNTVLYKLYETWDAAKFRSFCEKFALPERKPLKEFSKGMKMKAAIAAALSRESSLLILDEPTSGLDPVVRDEILELLYDYEREDRAILLSSHITSDLEKIADYIAFLHDGRLIFCEEKDKLLEKYAVYAVSEGRLSELGGGAIVRVLKREYGTEVLAERERMPETFEGRAVSLEELMLFYAKGEKVC